MEFFKATVLFAILMCEALLCNSQVCTYRITGIVTDVNHHPLSGVIVHIVSDSSKGAATDTNGNFSITAICPGSYTLSCNAFTYKEVKTSLKINGNKNLNIVMAAGGQ